MADIPGTIVLPSSFAQNALAAYRNTIAATRSVSTPVNSATYDDGYPPITIKPVDKENPESSGIPPKGGDANGILNDLSTPIFRAQMGLPINTWTSAIAALIYPAGAIVWYNGILYKSLSSTSAVPTNTTYWTPLSGRFVVDASTSAESPTWWRRWSDGWIEQGGFVSSSSQPTTVTFPVAFSTRVYSVLVTEQQTSGGDIDILYLKYGSVNVNSFQIQGYDTGGGADFLAYWEAKGF